MRSGRNPELKRITFAAQRICGVSVKKSEFFTLFGRKLIAPFIGTNAARIFKATLKRNLLGLTKRKLAVNFNAQANIGTAAFNGSVVHSQIIVCIFRRRKVIKNRTRLVFPTQNLTTVKILIIRHFGARDRRITGTDYFYVTLRSRKTFFFINGIIAHGNRIGTNDKCRRKSKQYREQHCKYFFHKNISRNFLRSKNAEHC